MGTSGRTHLALTLGILGLCGQAWLRAQQAANPLKVDGKVLRNAGSVANDALPGSWLSYGRDQGETRYSTLKQINGSNAKRLAGCGKTRKNPLKHVTQEMFCTSN